MEAPTTPCTRDSLPRPLPTAALSFHALLRMRLPLPACPDEWGWGVNLAQSLRRTEIFVRYGEPPVRRTNDAETDDRNTFVG